MVQSNVQTEAVEIHYMYQDIAEFEKVLMSDYGIYTCSAIFLDGLLVPANTPCRLLCFSMLCKCLSEITTLGCEKNLANFDSF